jgi:hypothetical protein
MKNFFHAIIDSVVTAALKTFDFFKSLRIKAIFADLSYSVKSLFSPSSSYDGFTTRKRIAVLVSAIVVVVAIVAAKQFLGSGDSAKRTIVLKDPVQKDEQGDVWTLSLMKGQATLSTTSKDKKPGEPLIVKPTAQVINRNVTVGVTLQGQAGEKYVPGVMKNGKWQNAPTFKLVTETGKVIAAGRFEYG